MINRIIRKLTQTSRLDEYRKILEYALSEGYILTSLADWYENNFYPDKKVLLLRHDVDMNANCALQMFKIELNLGVKSTYYFRWLTEKRQIINTISKSGFEISLHFETLATYCRKKNISSKSMLSQADLKNCFEILLKEKSLFETKYGRIKTLCSHGAPRNRKINTSNHEILKAGNRERLNIYFETYDAEILSKIDKYISDSSINTNHNWRNNLNPESEIQNQTTTICLLTHPQHWYYSPLDNLKHLYYDFYELLTS